MAESVGRAGSKIQAAARSLRSATGLTLFLAAVGLLALSVGGPAVCSGAPGARTVPAEAGPTARRLEAEIPRLMERWHIPGMSVALIEDGAVTWHRGFGLKDLNKGEAVDGNTVFCAASLTKPVFAYAALRMHDEGLFDLDTPLISYVPREYIEDRLLAHPMDMEGFRRDWFSKITARMALSHSSGIQGMGLKRPVEMLFEPGTGFHYSSHGIEYLRWVVEYLRGARIDTLVQEYVFGPLGMDHSSLSWRDDYASNSAAGHDKSGSTSGSIERFSFPTAQASLYTNARDYATFLAALAAGKGLKRETFAEMTRPQVEANPDVHWGLGLGLERTPGGTVLWHWGDAGTFTGYFAVNAAQRTGFVYLVNSYYGLAIVDRIMATVLGGPHPALSFSQGGWSFAEDYLSPARAFECLYLNESPGKALDFYEQTARSSPEGHRVIREARLAYWLDQFLAAGRAEDALNILRLRLEAYYPDRSQAFLALVERHDRDKNDESALRCLEAGAAAMADSQLTWALEGLRSTITPVKLDEALLRSCVGTYGPVEIAYEDGDLYYIQKAGSVRLKMIPMSEALFKLQDVDYYRVEVLKEDGSVTGLKGLYRDGRTKTLRRAP